MSYGCGYGYLNCLKVKTVEGRGITVSWGRKILYGVFTVYQMNRLPFEFKIKIILRQPYPMKIMIDQKQLENVEYFNYLGNMITNDARCTREIKSRIVMAKAAFNKKNLFTGLKFKEETSKVLHLEHSFVWY
jgi:hypothetical protein